MSVELKIKSKHLSEEARIIRFEERKLRSKVAYKMRKHREAGHNDPYELWNDADHRDWSSLQNHRKWDVRNENRATFLARAYIAGVPYKTVEHKRNDETLFTNVIFPRVCSMVVKYGKHEDGDWEWNREKGKYAPTKQLKDKIVAWSKI